MIKSTISEKLDVSGENGGVASGGPCPASGEAGGTGSANIGSIQSGSYESYYTNNN